MSSSKRIRVGRQVTYHESATVDRHAIITAVGADGTTVSLTVFTDANAQGVTRVTGVAATGYSTLAGAAAV